MPDRVGPYEILLPIASGGMATVYLARTVPSPGFPAEVALKLTHAHLSSTPEFANGLVEEGRLAERIRQVYELDMLCIRKALAAFTNLPAGSTLFLNIAPASLSLTSCIRSSSASRRNAGEIDSSERL